MEVDSPMSTLLAKIQIQPGKEKEFEDVMANMYRHTHDTEEGVLRYEYWRGREQGFYYCLLSFRDAESFWRHQASNHHEEEMDRFAACIASLDLETVDPVQQASPLPSTAAGPSTDELSGNIRQQANTYPIAVTAWWKSLRAR